MLYRRFWIWFGGIFLAVGVACLVAGLMLALVLYFVVGTGEAAGPVFVVPFILGMVFSAVGGSFMLVGLRRLRTDRRLREFGTTTEATIVAIERTGVRVNQRYLWRARYTYDDLNGVARYGDSGYLSADDAHRYTIGEQVFVRYDPADPATSSWLGREDRVA